MIEKRIFYLWCGSEKPVDVECCVLSWHRQLPDYESALLASGNRHTAVCLSLGVELLSQSSASSAFVFSTCLQQKSLAFSKAF